MEYGPACSGPSLKHYDYENIQNSACRPHGRPHGVLGRLVRTVAAHYNFVFFKTDYLIFNEAKFFKFKKFLLTDKRVFLKFKTDFTVDAKTSDTVRDKTDFDVIVFTVKHIAQCRQAG